MANALAMRIVLGDQRGAERLSARHPVVVTDACGGQDEAAMQRALASLTFAGDAILTDTATVCTLLRQSAGSARPAEQSVAGRSRQEVA
jgi:hypothetical protein